MIAKTEADFSPDSDPEQLLVTSLNILGNDKALSGNLADLSIVSTTACVNTKNGGFLKFTRDGTGGITGVKYGLPTRAIISEEKFDKAKDFVLAEISVWHAEELVRIENYYRNVSEVIDQFVDFYRANGGAGAGWFASAGGSSLKDIGSAAVGLKPGPGAVLSVGGRAMELLLSAYRNSQLETLEVWFRPLVSNCGRIAKQSLRLLQQKRSLCRLTFSIVFPRRVNEFSGMIHSSTRR